MTRVLAGKETSLL